MEHRRDGLGRIVLFLSRSCLAPETWRSTRPLTGQRSTSFRTGKKAQKGHEKCDSGASEQKEGLALVATKFPAARARLLIAPHFLHKGSKGLECPWRDGFFW